MTARALLLAPIALLLLAIAFLPLFAPRFWGSNRNKGLVASVCGVPVALYYLFQDPGPLIHAVAEYAAFIGVLGVLFLLSTKLPLRRAPSGTPASNTAWLAAGALLANLIGTTGASMLLARPMLRANSARRARAHVFVFLILIVSNCGGLLTPLGDPPLLLGWLRGVPFAWTLRLWPQWLLCLAWLLSLFYLCDRSAQAREGPVPPPAEDVRRPIDFHPLIEVAVLFAGIFATLIPALELLRESGEGLGLAKPWQYFWATGLFSSVLDNAPTYLAFAALAQGTLGLESLAHLAADPEGSRFLEAISTGAVFMGALTYIGNAPNFLVRAFAERAGVRMPSFLGFFLLSAATLLPLFLLVTWLRF